MVDKKKDMMQDWRGTIIHEGDTIVFVNVLAQKSYLSALFRDPESNRIIRPKVIPTNPNGFNWHPYWETEVFGKDGVLWLEIPPTEPGDTSSVIPIDLCWDFHKQNNLGALGNYFCIKGISDRHQDFYKSFLRENMSGDN